jgi:ABC-type antimicrobial peptide transport system permease subunit
MSYAFLNIFGLTLGIASCLVIFLIVRNELNYDNYSKADRIYRVTLNAIDFNSNVSLAITPAMRVDFPELEQVTQVMYSNQVMVKVKNNRFRDKDFAFADPSFPKIFDLQWIAGDPKTALSEPNSLVLNETLAKKYFGDKNPMGQVINIENQINAKVTGVIKDIPGNRSLPFQMLCSFETIKSQVKNSMNYFWNIGGGFFTFILLPPNYPISKVQSKVPAFLHKNWTLDPKEVRLPLQPLKDIHFDQRYINNIVTPTSKGTYYGLFGVALLIIITACINFINLATAQAIKRSKEVGVRKVLGANRTQLIKQFLGETTVLVLLAVIVGVSIASLFLSKAALLLNINIDAGQLWQPMVIVWIVCLTVAVILIAGLYPSFVQSAFQPVDSLKNQTVKSVRGFSLRKGLVVAQFAISQVLIVGTLIVARQMNYFQNQDLGFNKDAIVSFFIPDMKKAAALRQYMANDPGVAQFTFSSGAPTYNNSFTSFNAPQFGITKDDVTEVKFVDESYMGMFGLKMLAGQKITRRDIKDTTQNIIVNETLIHKMGIMDPAKAVGQRYTGFPERIKT